MTGATLCSGIMAPETAMPWVDWQWCAEIEPFPCSLIQSQARKNLGDIMAPDFTERAGYVDLLVAGTPCQAFSVAGLRNSLADHRGNLTLRFVEIVHAVRPRAVLWENVPGILSTADNAFGCFLAGLIGADDAIAPTAGWSSAGVATGPLGTAAWRILDAQYFGLAQRRARLFVVFCFGDGTDPAEILLEFESMRRDIAPSREAGQGVTHPTAPSLTSSGRGVDRGGDSRGQDPVVALCLNGGGQSRIDVESETFLTHSLRAEGFDASEDGTGRGTPLVAIPILEAGARTGVSTNDIRAGIGVGSDTDPMFTLQSGKQHAVGFQSKALAHQSMNPGAIFPTLDISKPDGMAVAYGIDEEQNASDDLMGTLKAREKGGGFEGGVAYGIDGRARGDDGRGYDRPEHITEEQVGAIDTVKPAAVAFTERTRKDGRNIETQEDLSYALTNPGSGGRTHSRQLLTPTMAVRRLTPRECERLQGFPDDYTAIAHRGKPAADGPRYKALGNSMAVPVIAWIGERIRKVVEV